MIKHLVVFVTLALLAVEGKSQSITMQFGDGGFWIKEGRDSIFFFQRDPKAAPDGTLARANYLHPLMSLDGEVLTEDFPVDHPYQRGLFWAWPRLMENNVLLADGWRLTDLVQEVKTIDFEQESHGGAVFQTIVQWRCPGVPGALPITPVVQEETAIKVYPRSKKYRRIDFTIQLKALKEGITLGGSDEAEGYGGFAARTLLTDGVNIRWEQVAAIEPGNLMEDAGKWITLSGTVGPAGKKAGLSIFQHPDNPGAPAQWGLHQGGRLRNCRFPGKEAVALKTDSPLMLNYAVIIHRGNLPEEKLDKLYRQFVAEH